MTDLEKFKALFDSVGIKYEEYTTDDGRLVLRHYGGYPEFFTDVVFSSVGEFFEMGAWE